MNRKPFSIGSFSFWSAYLIQCRPYLFFVSAAAGVSGMALVASVGLTQWQFWLAFIPFFISYGLGQALTDTFQTDTDRISAPYRPLSQGLLTPAAVRRVSLSGLSLCAVALVSLNPWNALFAALVVGGLSSYSYLKKKYWFAGPPYNAWIVALLPVMGFLAASQGNLLILKNRELLHLAALSFFSYANFVLMGYLKDIRADRETGYRTFPVVFGWDATVWVGDMLAAGSIVLALPLAGKSPAGLMFLALGVGVAISGQLFAHFTSNKQESNARFPIEATLRGFIFWQLAVIVCRKPDWVALAVLFYATFEWFLYHRPARNQI